MKVREPGKRAAVDEGMILCAQRPYPPILPRSWTRHGVCVRAEALSTGNCSCPAASAWLLKGFGRVVRDPSGAVQVELN